MNNKMGYRIGNWFWFHGIKDQFRQLRLGKLWITYMWHKRPVKGFINIECKYSYFTMLFKGRKLIFLKGKISNEINNYHQLGRQGILVRNEAC